MGIARYQEGWLLERKVFLIWGFKRVYSHPKTPVRIHPSIHPLVSKSNSHTMSFLKQLEEKKNALKKAEVSRKENTGPQEMIMKETEDYYRMMKETYFEAYYDQIEDFTFKSVILPMTLEDTQALMDAYTMYMDGTDKEVDLSVVDAKIDKGIALIREKAKKDCKVFVRLSSRSPKDAIYHLESFPNLIREKLSTFANGGEDLYSKLHAFYMASTEIMAVSNGREATDLMRRSNRIQGDMEEAVKNSEPMNLIIREFVHFPVKNELRGFCAQRRFHSTHSVQQPGIFSGTHREQGRGGGESQKFCESLHP